MKTFKVKQPTGCMIKVCDFGPSGPVVCFWDTETPALAIYADLETFRKRHIKPGSLVLETPQPPRFDDW